MSGFKLIQFLPLQNAHDHSSIQYKTAFIQCKTQNLVLLEGFAVKRIIDQVRIRNAFFHQAACHIHGSMTGTAVFEDTCITDNANI